MDRPLCINCRWFDNGWFTQNRYGKCKAPENATINYVDGTTTYTLNFAVNARLLNDFCGETGKWFKARGK